MIGFNVEKDSPSNNLFSINTVWHDLINIALGCSNGVPHEWYFLDVLAREEIKKDRELANLFVAFIKEYYNDYQWGIFISGDYLATAICELQLRSYAFKKKYEYEFYEDGLEDELTKAFILGEIATDFLIRYKGYSLVKCSGQKTIITSHSDCNKRFEEYLSNGYSLQRRSKIGYIKTTTSQDDFSHQKIKFYKLPVLPTKDIGYPIDEIIEMPNGTYQKVLQLPRN